MKENFIKLLTKDKAVRIFLVDVSRILERSHLEEMKTDFAKHLYTNLFINCCLLLGFLTEDDQRINVNIRFRPEECTAFCDLNGRGHINCTFSSSLAAFDGDFKDLVGEGASLSISRGSWMGGMFTGTVELKSASIDSAFSYFYSKSEQTETIFQTWIHPGIARGCLVQPLPFCHNDRLKDVMNQINHVEQEMISTKWSEVPQQLFPFATVVEKDWVLSECDCFKEMFMGILMSIETEELKKSIEMGKHEELECGVCGRKYIFGTSDLEMIVRMKQSGQGGSVS